MNNFKILLLLLIFLLNGCSNLAKNSTSMSEFYLSNGVFAEKNWKEDLIFKKISWFHELTLVFEILDTPYNPQSSFNYWLSVDELNFLNGCKNSEIQLVYSLDTNMIPYSKYFENLEKEGHKRFVLNNFKSHLLSHPDAISNDLRLFQVIGVCKVDQKSIHINIPGYTEVQI